MNLNKYPMVEKKVLEILDKPIPGDNLTVKDVIEVMGLVFQQMGPYGYAKHYGLLVNNSGEEFAIQFMSAYNELHPGTY